jgi:hypothetical protein
VEAINQVMSTRRTAAAAAAAAVGINGQCVAPVATTHISEVRAEMPSGMVPPTGRRLKE